MNSLLHDVFFPAAKCAWKSLENDISNIPAHLLNESVFRFLVIRALILSDQSIELQTEWNHIDLVVKHKERVLLVEFKFFMERYRMELQSNNLTQPIRRKGGPSNKNFNEFSHCFAGLKREPNKYQSGIPVERAIMLVYEHVLRDVMRPSSFGKWYGQDQSEHGRIQELLNGDAGKPPAVHPLGVFESCSPALGTPTRWLAKLIEI